MKGIKIVLFVNVLKLGSVKIIILMVSREERKIIKNDFSKNCWMSWFLVELMDF